ncbi:MAG: hypothetical protein MUC33_07460 [Desulfobacterales bacterium]|jgi:hypothetical protein|nr:hypothetical protein [Desulfobacterales bacterium]
MESEVNEMGPGAASDASEWHHRRLCSDESCIGVIGPDGRCKECGRPDAGAAAGGDAEAPRPEPSSEPCNPPPVSAETGAPDDEWASRRLCSDESCIGVIGADGRCRECGKPFAG